jgi:CRP/FNR family transcriptional regulator, nitrogen oxide reductase regulator
MEREALCGILSSNMILRDLNERECTLFMSHGKERRVHEKSYFFHQGEPAELFYILIEGQVKLTQVTPSGDQVILQIVGPGGGIGIIVALGQMDYPVSAEALEDCLAYAWDRQTTRELMLQIPQLALNGMELVARRFAMLQARYQEVATQRVEQRVAITLLRLVRQFGRREEEGVLIDMALSREDLAQMTGTNLYNVSRILSKWEQNGYVGLGRKRVTIRKAHELVMIAEGIT